MVTSNVPVRALDFLRPYWQIRVVADINKDLIDPAFFEWIFASYLAAETQMFLKLHIFDSTRFPYRKVYVLTLCSS